MIEIFTWKDTLDLEPAIRRVVQERFRSICQSYMLDDTQATLESLHLHDFGAIFVPKEGESIKLRQWEEVVQITADTGVFFICTYLPNNELACDIIIPEDMLTFEEREHFRRAL